MNTSTARRTISTFCCDTLPVAALALKAEAPGLGSGQRAIWELSQVKVYDGGSDGDADTAGDNTLFAVQGAFAP